MVTVPIPKQRHDEEDDDEEEVVADHHRDLPLQLHKRLSSSALLHFPFPDLSKPFKVILIAFLLFLPFAYSSFIFLLGFQYHRI